MNFFSYIQKENPTTLCMLSITDLNHELTQPIVRFHENNVEDYPFALGSYMVLLCNLFKNLTLLVVQYLYSWNTHSSLNNRLCRLFKGNVHHEEKKAALFTQKEKKLAYPSDQKINLILRLDAISSKRLNSWSFGIFE